MFSRLSSMILGLINENSFAQELLFEGCRELDCAKVRRAIQLGANVNLKSLIQNSHEKTPKQHSDDIFIFEKNGCSFSPLSLVAMHGDRKNENILELDKKSCEIAKLLLKHGADIDALDKGDMGNTALHWALVTFKKELCKLFIQHATMHNKNVINIANKPTRADMGSNPPLILALKAHSQSLIHRKHDLDIAEILISAGADVNAVDHFQQSALHWAAIIRCPMSFFKLLFEKQARVKINKFGETPKELYEAVLDKNMMRFKDNMTSFSELGFHLIACYKKLTQAIEFRNMAYQEDLYLLLKEMDRAACIESNKIPRTLFFFDMGCLANDVNEKNTEIIFKSKKNPPKPRKI